MRLLGWLLYRLREAIINRNGRLLRRVDRNNELIDWLDSRACTAYWRKRDRGL